MYCTMSLFRALFTLTIGRPPALHRESRQFTSGKEHGEQAKCEQHGSFQQMSQEPAAGRAADQPARDGPDKIGLIGQAAPRITPRRQYGRAKHDAQGKRYGFVGSQAANGSGILNAGKEKQRGNQQHAPGCVSAPAAIPRRPICHQESQWA